MPSPKLHDHAVGEPVEYSSKATVPPVDGFDGLQPKPAETFGVAGLVVAAMLLIAFLAEGVMRFLRARRRPFADSILPPELEQPAQKKKVDE